MVFSPWPWAPSNRPRELRMGSVFNSVSNFKQVAWCYLKEHCILYKPKEHTWNGYLFWQGIIPSFFTTSTHLILEISTDPFLYFFCKKKKIRKYNWWLHSSTDTHLFIFLFYLSLQRRFAYFSTYNSSVALTAEFIWKKLEGMKTYASESAD